MFFGCNSLKSIDITNFNTENIVNMGSMLADWILLNWIDLPNLNTKKVKYFTYMFADCSDLTSIDVSKFYTKNAEYLTLMFSGFIWWNKLISLNLSNFKTEKIINMRLMFYEYSKLKY